MAEAKRDRRSIDAADLIVLIGLGCLTGGAWFAIGPAALMLPGAVCVWYALPQRPPFVKKDR